MDFYQQKSQVRIADLRIGNAVKYGVVQTHLITGINLDDNSIKIRPGEYYTSGRVKESFALNQFSNKKEIVVAVDKVSSCDIYLKELNDYGFIWVNAYKVYFLIENNKFFVEAINAKSATVNYESPELTIKMEVYSLHELQNVFKFTAGIDFINIDKF